ncbi:MAG: DUF262 domain-containing protein [Bacteroidetes bacterium]|nr:DUF262 domain-containing protein [Bacteroidota bacterium]
MEGIKDTSTLTFRKILGNGLTYVIPKFQRDYSWENEHWDDLWQDLEDLYSDKETSHYMGYLILQTSDQKEHKVIDGQQRLTTMSLLIIAALKKLKLLEDDGIESENNRKRRENLHNSYIGYLDPLTLVPKNKLSLNRNNDNYYRAYIVPMEQLPIRNTNSSEKLLRSCFDWFFKKLGSKFKTGKELVEFIDKIVDRLFFTVITVGDELNAYKVFETLNARGVQLSSSDLLKNYLFSTVDLDPLSGHKEEFNLLEIYWSDILGKLGNDKLPEFLRYYWNSKNKTVRKNDLFKSIKRSVNSKGHVFELLRDLVRKVDIYKALLNPYDETWLGKPEIAKHLMELRLFGAKQPISLLISAYCNLSETEFANVLKACSVIYMRYNVIGGRNPNEQELVFNKIANFISDNKSFKLNDFRDVYPSDNEFEMDFANKELVNNARNRKVIRYILTKIENDKVGASYDFNDDKNSIEYILPENPGDEWKIDDDILQRCRYKIGNLTLLEKTKNNKLQNSIFKEKLSVFNSSQFQITKSIGEHYNNWGEDQIIGRQKSMAKRAKTIWKIQF